jgi:glucose-1-phosphatase
MKKPRLLLFDLGNVLVRFVPDLFPKNLGIGNREAQTQYEGGMRELTNKYESGQLSTQEYFSLLRAFFGNRFDIQQLELAFLSVLTDPIPGMEEIVRKATAQLPAALVSNTNEYHFSTILPKVPALGYLPRRYLSYQLSVIKPLPEFYRHVIQNEKVAPGEMLFIDDVAENVRCAERAGMVGYQFRSADELEKVFIDLGVL